MLFPVSKYRLTCEHLLKKGIAGPEDLVEPAPASDFPDHGEGFNLINDVAVAIRSMQKDGKIKPAMTVDCDVHHGNGTAAIFGVQSAEPTPGPERLPYMRESPARDVFTISLHQENNYPAWKPRSSIDVGLPDGIGDDEYLAWLEKGPRVGFATVPARSDLLFGRVRTLTKAI